MLASSLRIPQQQRSLDVNKCTTNPRSSTRHTRTSAILGNIFQRTTTSQKKLTAALTDILRLTESADKGLRTTPQQLVEIKQAFAELEEAGQKSYADPSGTWKLLWTTEKETLFIIKNAKFFNTAAGDVYQVIDTANNSLQNVITFPPEGAFIVNSDIDWIPGQPRVNFKFNGAALKLPGPKTVKLPPKGQGWFDNVYTDGKYRLSRDIRGDYLVCVKDGAPKKHTSIKINESREMAKATHSDPIDLTGHDSDDEPTSKRHKPSEAPKPSSSSKQTQEQRHSSRPSNSKQHREQGSQFTMTYSFYDPPFHLFRVRGIENWANQGFLGIKLADLVTGDIQLAVISNYMIDLAWLLTAAPAMRAIPKIIIIHGEHPDRGALQIQQDAQNAGLLHPVGRTVIHRPPLQLKYGVHHSKYILLQYKTGFRVIIFTANLIYCDCNNKSQGLFYQDFPPKDAQSPRTSDFEEDLLRYIQHNQLPKNSYQALESIIQSHDFSAARVRLIASVPGYHKQNEMHRWGHKRVQSCLNNAPGGFGDEFVGAPIAAQFSSMGSLNIKWLEDEFRASLSAGNSNGRRLGLPSKSGPDGFALMWPTASEVKNSLEGWFAGSSIPGSTENVSKDFLQPYYHRWGGEAAGRSTAMPHIKTYIRYNPRNRNIAWFLNTSHNLSRAAWGDLQKQQTQIMIRHYELGTLHLPGIELNYLKSRWRGFSCTSNSSGQQQPQPVLDALIQGITRVKLVRWQRGEPQESRFAYASEGGPSNEQLNTVIVPLPVPYELPPCRYVRMAGSIDGDVPWSIGRSFSGKDVWGRTVSNPKGHMYGLIESMEWGDVG